MAVSSFAVEGPLPRQPLSISNRLRPSRDGQMVPIARVRSTDRIVSNLYYGFERMILPRGQRHHHHGRSGARWLRCGKLSAHYLRSNYAILWKRARLDKEIAKGDMILCGERFQWAVGATSFDVKVSLVLNIYYVIKIIPVITCP